MFSGGSIEAVDDPDVTPRGAAMLAGPGHRAVRRLSRGRREVRTPRPSLLSPIRDGLGSTSSMYRISLRAAPDSLQAINHRLAEIAVEGAGCDGTASDGRPRAKRG